MSAKKQIARQAERVANTKRIVFYGANSSRDFSGGRYYVWMLAEALSEAGWQVDFITNERPSFYRDFDNPSQFPGHASIQLHLRPILDRDGCAFPELDFDVFFIVPHGNSNLTFYEEGLAYAFARHARIVLMNFESGNWFNALSPSKRDLSCWDGWKVVSEYASMVLSLTAEGTTWARPFYDTAAPAALFEHLWAPINSRIADSLGVVPKEKRILFLTRFSAAEHKGADLIPELFCEAMRGHKAVFIVGVGKPNRDYLNRIKLVANKYNVKIEMLGTLNELEKWREFKRASLVLFPSYFEGFGLPPVEAQYAGTPCIAFDLPVLREVSGEGIKYVPCGDTAAMRARIAEVLSGKDNFSNLTGQLGPAARFEDFIQRANSLFTRLLHESLPVSLVSQKTPVVGLKKASDGFINYSGHTFTFERHAVYFDRCRHELIGQWLNSLPRGAVVNLLASKQYMKDAQNIAACNPQVVCETIALEEMGAKHPKLESVMLTVPDAQVELQFKPGVFIPELSPHYAEVRKLWLAGFRKFALASESCLTCIDIPHLLDEYVDRHRGKRCFVVGNGPSLNELDMSLLQDEITMGTNRCYLGYEKWGYAFTYWGLLDRLQVEEYGPEYEQNIPKGTPKFFPFEYASLLHFDNACPVPMTFNSNPPYKFSDSPEQLFLGFTVVHMMLQIAVIMGCNPIYLIGCDHRYNLKLDESNAQRAGTRDARIWTAQDATKPTHFTDKYTGGSEAKKFITPKPELMDAAFEAARIRCDSIGTKVYNATPNSGLKAFPMVDYKELF